MVGHIYDAPATDAGGIKGHDMAHTYGTHGQRLMRDHVTPGNFGGFLTWDGTNRTEQLFALDSVTGKILTRQDRIGCNEFDGHGWTACESIPNHAEWIGNYPAPKARQVIDGTRIALQGKVGGFQE